jgi:MOSC domain-containing protein YiiM
VTSSFRLEALLTGRVRPLGPAGVPSGIDKRAVDRAIRLTKRGFAGDEQGDTHHHGGPDKAVHHYPSDHYEYWAEELGAQVRLTQPGAFGENLAIRGLLETDVAIGDRFRLGTALVEVSQGRQPCFRLNLRMGVPDVALRMQQSGRTGWYYRVIEEGLVSPGDDLTLVDRLTPSWTVERLWRVLYVDTMDRESLSAMVVLAHLPERWRAIGLRRLERGAVEDWDRRLHGR